jgi:hypothetical protein
MGRKEPSFVCDSHLQSSRLGESILDDDREPWAFIVLMDPLHTPLASIIFANGIDILVVNIDGGSVCKRCNYGRIENHLCHVPDAVQ